LKHFIILQARRRDIEDKAKCLNFILFPCNFSSISELRSVVSSFTSISRVDEVFLCDVGGFTERERMFSVFLKALETESCKGGFWFFGAEFSDYPFNIRSRCNILSLSSNVLKQEFKDSLEKTLKMEKGEKFFVSDTIIDLYLKYFEPSLAIKLIRAKDGFVSFLLGLHSFTKGAFNVQYLRWESLGSSHVVLFREWLMRGEIFSNWELDLCPFLRSSSCLKSLEYFLSNPDESIAQQVFPFVCAYKVLRV